MNKVILIGNLANDPEAFTTQSGISRSTFRLAVQRRFTNAQGVREADFFTIVAWRQSADFCNRYLKKGNRVAVEGSVQNRSYEANDGSTRWITEIIADSVESVGSRESRYPGPTEPQTHVSSGNSNTQTAQPPAIDPDDDELPF